jgi:hypothetical protein
MSEQSERTTVAILQSIAYDARQLGADSVTFGVNDEATERLESVAGAEMRATVFCHDDGEAYVIESAEVQIGGVRFRAQRNDRPAAPEELAHIDRAEDVHEHKAAYRAAPLRS